MKLLITGASGRLGRLTAEHLLTTQDPADLILTTRSPVALGDLAARGVDVREADFGRPGSLAAAFAGADRLLLISTDAIGMREAQHRAAVEAAVHAGVGFIAYTSFPIAEAKDPISVEHAATEALVRSSGLEWCILRNFPYGEGQIGEMQRAASTGELMSNTGAGRTAYAARDDCAAVAAVVLSTDGHAGAVYDVTGPDALDAADLAALFADVSGTPVRLHSVDDEALASDLSSTGIPFPVALAMVSSIGSATRGGLYATVSDTVERLTGIRATTLRTVLERSQAASQGSAPRQG